MWESLSFGQPIVSGNPINSKASVHFIKAMVDEDRRALAMYPVFLFYLFLAWFIIL